MDFSIILKSLIDLFIKVCSVKCTFAGIEFSVGSVFIWCALASIFIGFLGRGAE